MLFQNVKRQADDPFFLGVVKMQRHIKVLDIGAQKVRMEITAPSKYDLSRIKITFTSAADTEAKTDWRKALVAKEFPAKKKKQKQIGFAAISASERKC